jgi:hypothetical protein
LHIAQIENSVSKKEKVMNKYMAVHAYKASCEATWAKLGEMAPTISVEMEDGVTPARCTLTWNPFTHGRKDMIFCLWEANEPKDVITSLGELNDFITTDLLEVDEIVWANIAAAAKAAKVAA